MKILVKPFHALTTEELYALLQLRSEIFVVEQQCIYQDMDGADALALHVNNEGLPYRYRIGIRGKGGGYFCSDLSD